jgi:hypothetical protein
MHSAPDFGSVCWLLNIAVILVTHVLPRSDRAGDRGAHYIRARCEIGNSEIKNR